MRGSENAALLHRVIQHRENRGRAGSADRGETESLEDFTDGVTDRRGRSERQIGHAKRDAEFLRHVAADDFTDARHLEGRELDRFGNIVHRDMAAVVLLFDQAVKRLLHNARTGNTDVDHDVRLTDTEVGAGHEGHVLGNVAEDNELRRADTVAVRGRLGDIKHALAHQGNRVHVDTGLRAAHVDRGADAVRGREGFRQRVDQVTLTGGDALLNESAETAHKVDTDFLRGSVKLAADGGKLIAREGGADRTDRRNRNTLVHNRNAVAVADHVAGLNEALRILADLRAETIGKRVVVGARAVEQADTERHRTHVKVLGPGHVDGGKDLVFRNHCCFSP